MSMNFSLAGRWSVLAVSMALVSVSVAAQAATNATVTVGNVWIRPAVKGQSGTGGFLTMVSPQPVTLVGFKTPVAGVAELHDMVMDGDVMRMRPMDALPLKPGQVTTLAPGGKHLMLMKLKRPLSAGDVVPLTLLFKDAKGQGFAVSTEGKVQMQGPGSGEPSHSHDDMKHDHGHMHH